jgi:hypothetical protein
MLNHHNRVRTGRHRSARHNLNRFTRMQARLSAVARAHLTANFQNTGNIRRANRKPVTQTPLQSRIIAVGTDRLSQHAAMRFACRHKFGTALQWQTAYCLQHHAQSVCKFKRGTLPNHHSYSKST